MGGGDGEEGIGRKRRWGGRCDEEGRKKGLGRRNTRLEGMGRRGWGGGGDGEDGVEEVRGIN